MASTPESASENYKAVYRELRDRFVTPWRRPSALGYAVFFVAGLGALGVWAAAGLLLLRDATKHDLAISLITYVVSVVFSALGDINFDRQGTRTIRFWVLVFALVDLLITAVLWAAPMMNKPALVSAYLALPLTILPAWLLWLLVSGGDPRFAPELDPEAAAGGAVDQELA